jgi:hypothetical protein
MSEEIVIHVPERITSDKIVWAIDKVILDLGLVVSMRGALKSFPGSTHWHVKRGRERGTLEATWWPQRRKLWIKVQARRTAPWIDEIAPRFKKEVESCLAGRDSRPVRRR